MNGDDAAGSGMLAVVVSFFDYLVVNPVGQRLYAFVCGFCFQPFLVDLYVVSFAHRW